MIYTALEFKAATGRDPEDDDLERCNCPDAGKAGHQQCGWCKEHDVPVFHCMHKHVASEFRVDRPGRYKRRDGGVDEIEQNSEDAEYYKYGCLFRSRLTGIQFNETGLASLVGAKYSYDLIAYLGPLEEERPVEVQPEGIITRLERELAEALAEITRLKLEIDALEKSRNHCEFCDAQIAKPVPCPSIPLTTRTTEHYLSPLLGGEWAR